MTHIQKRRDELAEERKALYDGDNLVKHEFIVGFDAAIKEVEPMMLTIYESAKEYSLVYGDQMLVSRSGKNLLQAIKQYQEFKK